MKGLTLVEIIISIVVFAIIIVPLVNIFSTVSKDTDSGIYINRASTMAASYMELILSRSFDEEAAGPFTDPAALGPDTGESSVSDYDDVDDFNGHSFTDSDYPSLTANVAVYYVQNPDTAGSWDSPSAAATNYKRIDITVNHPQLGTVSVAGGVSYAGHNTK
ncbi:MAG: prepilin-type N-terminal cleavage/methylation domain-containing protein [Candidatus Omnitrophica bacterium]|nr:prepilin-type N-terminal cleavage/methylation domain-containing protein [Candidatus Omnitrophota bacterium]